MINSGTIAKFTVATILGLISAHFWSIGETRLSVFIMATMIFHIFFIVSEKTETKISEQTFESMFAKEMKKWKDNNLF